MGEEERHTLLCAVSLLLPPTQPGRKVQLRPPVWGIGSGCQEDCVEKDSESAYGETWQERVQ